MKKKNRPLQIRDGVILDPNALKPQKAKGDVLPKRLPGSVRPPAPCPGYAKLKTKEQLEKLARVPWDSCNPKKKVAVDPELMIGAYI